MKIAICGAGAAGSYAAKRLRLNLPEAEIMCAVVGEDIQIFHQPPVVLPIVRKRAGKGALRQGGELPPFVRLVKKAYTAVQHAAAGLPSIAVQVVRLRACIYLPGEILVLHHGGVAGETAFDLELFGGVIGRIDREEPLVRLVHVGGWEGKAQQTAASRKPHVAFAQAVVQLQEILQIIH